MTESLSWHRPGQKVACIFADALPDVFPCLVKDEIYTIEHVSLFMGTFHIALVERPQRDHRGEPYFYYANRFRPVRETDISQFNSLLSPTPEDEARFLIELAEMQERADA